MFVGCFGMFVDCCGIFVGCCGMFVGCCGICVLVTSMSVAAAGRPQLLTEKVVDVEFRHFCFT